MEVYLKEKQPIYYFGCPEIYYSRTQKHNSDLKKKKQLWKTKTTWSMACFHTSVELLLLSWTLLPHHVPGLSNILKNDE